MAKNLLFDYSFQVRRTLAINLPKIRVEQEFFLNELLQDEDEVVQATCQAVSDYILLGKHELLPNYIKMISLKQLPANLAILNLPKVLRATNTVEQY